MALRILFIGGNGIISSASSALAVERGDELTLLNRGQSTLPAARRGRHGSSSAMRTMRHPSPPPSETRRSTSSRTSARSRPRRSPATSSSSRGAAASTCTSRRPRPTRSPSRGCRSPSRRRSATRTGSTRATRSRAKTCSSPRTASAASRSTIIRPSHTYDRTSIPILGGWTAIDRMRRGLPVVVHGDGTSLWTMTHTRDFAVAFVGLLGNDRAVGEAFQITSDEVLTWNQITRTARARRRRRAARRAHRERGDRPRAAR